MPIWRGWRSHMTTVGNCTEQHFSRAENCCTQRARTWADQGKLYLQIFVSIFHENRSSPFFLWGSITLYPVPVLLLCSKPEYDTVISKDVYLRLICSWGLVHTVKHSTTWKHHAHVMRQGFSDLFWVQFTSPRGKHGFSLGVWRQTVTRCDSYWPHMY